MSDKPQVSFGPSPSEPAEPYVYQPFPQMVFKGDDYLIVPDEDALSAALSNGWKTRDQLNNLDRDDNGEPGGSKPRRRKTAKEA